MTIGKDARLASRNERLECRDDIIKYISSIYHGEYHGPIKGIEFKDEVFITATELYLALGKYSKRFIGLQMPEIGFRKSSIRTPTRNVSVWRAKRIGHSLDM
jgi:hypothetical protein